MLRFKCDNINTQQMVMHALLPVAVCFFFFFCTFRLLWKVMKKSQLDYPGGKLRNGLCIFCAGCLRGKPVFSTALNPLAYMYLCMSKNYNFVHSFEPGRIRKHHLSLCQWFSFLFFLSPSYSYINILVVTITLMSIKKYLGVSPKKGFKGEYFSFSFCLFVGQLTKMMLSCLNESFWFSDMVLQDQ